MTDVPKIVHHRLRATTPEQYTLEQAHPEADLLTAFAEQAVSAAEREGVLQHLALCADCRDVVALALPAAEVTPARVEAESEAIKTPLPAEARAHWFAWANPRWARLSWAHLSWAHLGWAALAAGIAVAVLVVRPELDHLSKPNPTTSSIARQSAASAVPSASSTQVASESMATGAVEAKHEASGPRAGLPADKPRALKPLPPGEQLATASNGNTETAKPGAAPAPGAVALNAPRSMNEGVAVEASPVSVEPATDGNLMARADAPAIEKAKPPLEGSEVSEPQKTMAAPRAPAMLALKGGNVLHLAAVQPNANWKIAAGVLQHSLDGGQSWQTAVQAPRALLCYAARGQEVWAGGKVGTLLHSTDSGATWNAVAVSFKGQPLSSDVTHIDVIDVDVPGPAAIVLATDNHESWSSTDSGKTWEKK